MRNVSRRQFFVVTAGGIAASYAAAACGDDDDENGSSTAAGTAAATSAAMAGASASPTVDAGSDNGAVGLRWFGQSMFLLTSPGGTTVLIDPFVDIGYLVPPPLDTTAATISHEHPDHSNDPLAGASATVLRGLTADGFAGIDETFGDVRVRTVSTYHDEAHGTQRGNNAVFVYEIAGLTFAHLGDLGHQLDDAQASEIGSVDVLMVPVGGTFTLDGVGASSVTDRLAPKMVFPMHYQTARAGAALADASAFLAGMTVEETGTTDIRIAQGTLPPELTAYVLNYE
jgi:L-ascorbate metabolism protein UlaG (beta-lactamase superfamily)